MLQQLSSLVGTSLIMKIWAENSCWPQADPPSPACKPVTKTPIPRNTPAGKEHLQPSLGFAIREVTLHRLGNGQRGWGVRSLLTYSLLYHLWTGITHWPFQTVLKLHRAFQSHHPLAGHHSTHSLIFPSWKPSHSVEQRVVVPQGQALPPPPTSPPPKEGGGGAGLWWEQRAHQSGPKKALKWAPWMWAHLHQHTQEAGVPSVKKKMRRVFLNENHAVLRQEMQALAFAVVKTSRASKRDRKWGTH